MLVEARLVEANDGFSRNLGAKLGFADLRGVRGGDAGYQVNGNQRVAVGGNLTGVGQVTGQTAGHRRRLHQHAPLVNLPAARSTAPTPPTIAFSLFSAAANRFLNLELSALEADGKGKIISSPRVVTEDNVAAVIEQGVELPYQQATSSGATVGQFKQGQPAPGSDAAGHARTATWCWTSTWPRIAKGEATTSGSAINTQHVKTKVMVENGGTVVLGGIYQQTETTQRIQGAAVRRPAGGAACGQRHWR